MSDLYSINFQLLLEQNLFITGIKSLAIVLSSLTLVISNLYKKFNFFPLSSLLTSLLPLLEISTQSALLHIWFLIFQFKNMCVEYT